MLNFDVQTQSEGSSALVTIRGDFDLQVAARVADELAEVEATGPDLLVIDLSGLSFMDSSGMGVIAAAQARATEAGRRLLVVKPPPTVRRAFDLSRFGEMITIVDDVADVYP